MKLPTIGTPTYETKLHSIDKPVTYRPFLVGEQKILLMAAESTDSGEIIRALKTCVKKCTDGAVDVETLPLFDLVTLFIRIRSKAVGEIMEKIYVCQGETEAGDKCGNEIHFTINLDDVELQVDEDHKNTIQLTDQVGVKMKYPTISGISEIGDIESPIGQLEMIISSIESIYSDDNIVDTSEVSKEELEEWMGTLNPEHLKKIVEFFITQPKLIHEIELECPKCTSKTNIILKEIEDFF